jgi:hypothetical protein
MVQDISGINNQINKEIAEDEDNTVQMFNYNKSKTKNFDSSFKKKAPVNEMVLEDIDDFNDDFNNDFDNDFNNIKSPGLPKTTKFKEA